jgi:hypothetical protein
VLICGEKQHAGIRMIIIIIINGALVCVWSKLGDTEPHIHVCVWRRRSTATRHPCNILKVAAKRVSLRRCSCFMRPEWPELYAVLVSIYIALGGPCSFVAAAHLHTSKYICLRRPGGCSLVGCLLGVCSFENGCECVCAVFAAELKSSTSAFAAVFRLVPPCN